ncbi:hypothetical protein D9611_011305 [Ephemerocybe angulata]|uniref:Uncharacterized protein n=1 Tax=Ephemerocybe angulata TaxID=980116 RepID=A0A8H5BDS7_9AGAR|nr:hypothetical protein D9611_011305 [Tulosesus angulatus]
MLMTDQVDIAQLDRQHQITHHHRISPYQCPASRVRASPTLTPGPNLFEPRNTLAAFDIASPLTPSTRDGTTFTDGACTSSASACQARRAPQLNVGLLIASPVACLKQRRAAFRPVSTSPCPMTHLDRGPLCPTPLTQSLPVRQHKVPAVLDEALSVLTAASSSRPASPSSLDSPSPPPPVQGSEHSTVAPHYLWLAFINAGKPVLAHRCLQLAFTMPNIHLFHPIVSSSRFNVAEGSLLATATSNQRPTTLSFFSSPTTASKSRPRHQAVSTRRRRLSLATMQPFNRLI